MVLKKKEALMVVMKSDYTPGIISKILVSAGLYAEYKTEIKGRLQDSHVLEWSRNGGNI